MRRGNARSGLGGGAASGLPRPLKTTAAFLFPPITPAQPARRTIPRPPEPRHQLKPYRSISTASPAARSSPNIPQQRPGQTPA